MQENGVNIIDLTFEYLSISRTQLALEQHFYKKSGQFFFATCTANLFFEKPNLKGEFVLYLSEPGVERNKLNQLEYYRDHTVSQYSRSCLNSHSGNAD